MSETVAFLGLGVMGYPMAGHLARHGHTMRVYNRSAARAEAWLREHGGSAHPTPAAAAQGAALVFCCVGNDDDLRQVCLGAEGAFAGMAERTLFVDHTTTSAQVAKEMAHLAREAGIGFIDAPVSGGQAGAENGVLTVMCGGDAGPYGRAEPVIAASWPVAVP